MKDVLLKILLITLYTTNILAANSTPRINFTPLKECMKIGAKAGGITGALFLGSAMAYNASHYSNFIAKKKQLFKDASHKDLSSVGAIFMVAGLGGGWGLGAGSLIGAMLHYSARVVPYIARKRLITFAASSLTLSSFFIIRQNIQKNRR